MIVLKAALCSQPYLLRLDNHNSYAYTVHVTHSEHNRYYVEEHTIRLAIPHIRLAPSSLLEPFATQHFTSNLLDLLTFTAKIFVPGFAKNDQFAAVFIGRCNMKYEQQ